MYTENDNYKIKTLIKRLVIAIISIGLFIIVMRFF